MRTYPNLRHFFRGAKSIDLMPQDLNFTLEDITRSGRPGDRQALAFHGQQAFQGGVKCCCHTGSDGRPSLMFTAFDNIASGPKLGTGLGSGSFWEVFFQSSVAKVVPILAICT